MSVELLQILSLISYILACIFLIVSVVLFFLFDIPKLVGDLTGVTEKKAIESIKRQNENMDLDGYNNLTNINYVKTKNNSENRQFTGFGIVTEKISTAKLSNTSADTMVLNTVQNETTILNNNSQEIINFDNSQTALLYNNYKKSNIGQNAGEFFVEFQLFFYGSDEIIE